MVLREERSWSRFISTETGRVRFQKKKKKNPNAGLKTGVVSHQGLYCSKKMNFSTSNYTSALKSGCVGQEELDNATFHRISIVG